MRTLALQGGGILGYGQTVVLSKLEALQSKFSYQMFDMIGGTSVGAIIGAHLSIGLSAQNISSFFTTNGPKIFEHNWLTDLTTLITTKYNSETIESALKARLGDYSLKDCKTKFLATSYDWASDRPVYFKSYEKSYSTKDYIIIGYDDPIKLWQVARASSAAQSYFPAYLYNGLVLLDGGNIGDNAPDMIVTVESLSFDSLNNISMLSIGAGDTLWNNSASSMQKPSLLRAGLSTITIVFSAGESAEIYKTSRLLGNKYLRISPNLGNGFSIDDASEATLNALKAAAETLIQSNSDILVKFSKN